MEAPEQPPSSITHEVGKVLHVSRQTLGHPRVLLIGDGKVGKTSLARCLSKSGPFIHDYTMTGEPLVTFSSVPVPGMDPPSAVTCILVDTPGSGIYHQRAGVGLLKGLGGGSSAAAASSTAPASSSQPLAVALCFDIGKRDSLQTAGKLLKSLGLGQDVIGVLVGCKADLRGGGEGGEGGGRAECSFTDGTTTASQLGFKYFECSALTGEGVAAPFEWIAGEAAHRL